MAERECNVDDILCQIEALKSMRSLRNALGNETFMSEFPELIDLEPRLRNKIESAKGNIKEALTKCGNIDLEEASLVSEEEGAYLSEIEED